MKKALLFGLNSPSLNDVVKRDVNYFAANLKQIDSASEITKFIGDITKSELETEIKNWIDNLSSENPGILYISAHAIKESSNVFVECSQGKISNQDFKDLLLSLEDNVNVEIVLDFCYSDDFWSPEFKRTGMNFWTSSQNDKESYGQMMSLFTSSLFTNNSNSKSRGSLLNDINSDLDGVQIATFYEGIKSGNLFEL